MTVARPDKSELRRAASLHHLHLSAEEEEAYAQLFDVFLRSFDALEEMPDPAPSTDASGRTSWVPDAPDNPYNAIVRRCRVKGAEFGILAGKRIGLKDNISVAGVEMSLGSGVVRGFRPKRDATLVARLLAAGAEIAAILNMDAFAYSGAGDTSLNGPTLNPHDKTRLAGGSSGGSAAALFHDDIDITFGADQGGSIRIPAAWCGVVGMKPTHGLIPYTGATGLDLTYDHLGPLAHSVADVALALDTVAGKDPGDARQEIVPEVRSLAALRDDLRGVRVALVAEGFGLPGEEREVADSVRAAAEAMARLGATITEVSVPMHRQTGPIAWGLFAEAVAAVLSGNGLGYHWRGTYDVEMAIAVGEGLRARGDLLPPQGKIEAMLGSYLRERYQGRFYAKSQNLRVALREAYDRALGNVDILLMPTTPMTAQRYQPSLGIVDRVLTGWAMLGNTAGFNMTGHPSLSVPCGTAGGLPVGIMMTGRHFEDAALLGAAHAYEQARGPLA